MLVEVVSESCVFCVGAKFMSTREEVVRGTYVRKESGVRKEAVRADPTVIGDGSNALFTNFFISYGWISAIRVHFFLLTFLLKTSPNILL